MNTLRPYTEAETLARARALEAFESEPSAGVYSVLCADLRAAEAAFLGGDSTAAHRLAADVAYRARQARQGSLALEAAGLQRMIRDLDRRVAMAGWGTR